MSTDQFEIGRAYWLRDGREVEYLARTDDGRHVVSPTVEIETYDGCEFSRGPVEFATELFIKPPIQKRSEEIVALEVRVRELEKRKAELYSECINSEREVRARLDSLKKFSGLERIEDFVEGRITHVVIENYGDTIYDVTPLDNLQQYTGGYNRKPEGIRLISLFGKTEGDLQWRVNQWRDESGTWRMIVPCSSEEEGRAKRATLIAEGLAAHWADYQPDHAYSFLRFAKASIDSGIALSAEQDEAYRAAVTKALERNRASLTKEIADRQSRLAEVESKITLAAREAGQP